MSPADSGFQPMGQPPLDTSRPDLSFRSRSGARVRWSGEPVEPTGLDTWPLRGFYPCSPPASQPAAEPAEPSAPSQEGSGSAGGAGSCCERMGQFEAAGFRKGPNLKVVSFPLEVWLIAFFCPWCGAKLGEGEP